MKELRKSQWFIRVSPCKSCNVFLWHLAAVEKEMLSAGRDGPTVLHKVVEQNPYFVSYAHVLYQNSTLCSYWTLHFILSLFFSLCGSTYKNKLMKALDTAHRVLHGMSKFFGNTKLWLWRHINFSPLNQSPSAFVAVVLFILITLQSSIISLSVDCASNLCT